MKITPIAEILDQDAFPDKSVVFSVRGKITKLYKVTKGQNDKGPWELQNGELTDDTGTIRVTFGNATQLDSARGKIVTISAFKSEQHGWIGLKVNDSSFESKETGEMVHRRELKVTSAATIDYGDGGQRQQPSGAGKSTTSESPRKPVEQRHPKVILEDIVALHLACHRLVNESYGDADIPDEYVAQIYIQACRENLHVDYRKRAAKEVPLELPPVPKDPANWRQCYIPSGTFAGKTLADLPDDKLKELFDALDSKQSNTPFAECVYQAARERKVVTTKDELAPEVDDIPF